MQDHQLGKTSPLKLRLEKEDINVALETKFIKVHLGCCGEVSGEDFGLEEALLVEPKEEAYFLF